MFAKLLKHEIKSIGGMLGLLSLAALAVGVIGGFLFRFNMNEPAMAEAYEVFSVVSSVALPVVVLSLIAYAIGGEIYLAMQFYKRKFTDEGYLTFTLPAPAWQIYLSSLLNVMLWTLVISVVVMVAFLCLFFIGIYDTMIWNILLEQGPNVTMEFETVFEDLGNFNLLYVVAEYVSSNVLLLTSITLGCVLAKKHKVLGSIGAYYATSILISAVNTWLTGRILDVADVNFEAVYLLSAVMSGVVAVGGSLLTIWLMDKKLNLP